MKKGIEFNHGDPTSFTNDKADKNSDVISSEQGSSSRNFGKLSILNFKYHGDLFSQRGTYNDGLLYLSRLPPSKKTLDNVKTSSEKSHARRRSVIDLQEKHLKLNLQTTKRKASRKRQCSQALEEMTRNPLLHESLLQDNIIQTLFTLCGLSDVTSVNYAIAALCNLSCDNTGRGGEELIRSGCIQVLQNVLIKHQDNLIQYNCMALLSNLTLEDGFEGVYVKDRGVDILRKYGKLTTETRKLCLTSLFNLTCPAYSYPRIDDVIGALVEVSLECEDPELATRGLYNICCINANQVKFVEHDGLGVLTVLSGKSNPAKLNVIKAVSELAKNSSCREALQNKECLRILVSSLSSDLSLEDLQRVLSTLSNLASNPNNSIHFGKAGTLSILSKLGLNITHPELKADLFRAIGLLISHEENSQFIDESILSVLTKFDHTSTEEDPLASRFVLYCIGRISAEFQPQSNSVFSDQKKRENAMASIFDIFSSICADDDTPEDYLRSLILYNFSFCADKVIFSKKAAEFLMEIGKRSSRGDMIIFACGGLLNTAKDSKTHSVLLQKDALETIDSALESRKDMVVVLCLEIISLLFSGGEVENLAQIVEVVFPKLVRHCTRENPDVRSRCAYCFSLFSRVKECRTSMVRNGLISSLSLLAGDDDARTLQLCVSTYSHLSCDPQICQDLIENGIVKSLTSLSAAPEEKVRRACAIAFCNLSSLEANVTSLVQKRILPAILVISCVKSNDKETRKLCMKAIMNLIRKDENLKQLCEEGLIWAFAIFSAQAEAEDAEMIARAFCTLTHSKDSRLYCEKVSTLNSFLSLINFPDDNVKIILLKGVLNLLQNRSSVEPLLNARILNYLKELALSNDVNILSMVSRTLAVIYQISPSSHHRFVQSGSLEIVASLLTINDDKCKWNCAIFVHLMSLNIETVSDIIIRRPLLEAIINTVENCGEESMYLLMRTIYNISCGHVSFKDMCKLGVVDAISFILNSKKDESDTLKMCGAILRNLSTDPNCHSILVDEDATRLLSRIFEVKDKACKEDCAMAVCNLCLGQVNTSRLLKHGALEPVLWLSIHSSTKYTMICSAVLRKLATPPGNISILCEGNVIERLVSLINVSSNPYVKENCIAALALLSDSPKARPLISSVGGVSSVIGVIRGFQGNLNSSLEQMSADLLSNMASYVRAGDSSEDTVSSTLLQLLELDTKNEESDYWKNGRAYLIRGNSGSLPEAEVSSERKLLEYECPKISLILYPVEHDAYSAGFSCESEIIETTDLKQEIPSIEFLGQKANFGCSDAFIKSFRSSHRSPGWRKIATTKFAHSNQMYSKIRSYTGPHQVVAV